MRTILVQLSIRNFAIISELHVEFQQGLNVLTGETGAGKSILIDALALLTGGRSSVDFVRHGARKAEIEGLFSVQDGHPVFDLLCDLGIDRDESGIILRRDISAQGKSVCRMNGKLVTLAILRQVGQLLMDIHGQHAHHSLLNDSHHLQMVDQFGQEKLEAHKREYRNLYTKYRKINEQIRQLTENEQQMHQRMDVLRFQLQEIHDAHLEPGEDERIAQQQKMYRHSQRLFDGIDQSYRALQDPGGANELLGLIMHHLQDLSDIDPHLKEARTLAENCYYQLEELTFQIRQYNDQLEFDPQALNELENRLAEIEKLKRKYGKSVTDILEYAAKIEEELGTIENREDRIQHLEKRRKEIELDLVVEAEHLTHIRKKIASHLTKHIHQELHEMYMPDTVVHIDIVPQTTGLQVSTDRGGRMIREDGWDKVQFQIATNRGEPLRPLSKVASGGELSRFMLALKAIFSEAEPITAVVFDEVDTGVSGRVSQSMAERMYRISCTQQVLCITHQPPVAAMADYHYRIIKKMEDTQTESAIVPLSVSERLLEMARMMSGPDITNTTKKHAQELLDQAKNRRKEMLSS